MGLNSVGWFWLQVLVKISSQGHLLFRNMAFYFLFFAVMIQLFIALVLNSSTVVLWNSKNDLTLEIELRKLNCFVCLSVIQIPTPFLCQITECLIVWHLRHITVSSGGCSELFQHNVIAVHSHTWLLVQTICFHTAESFLGIPDMQSGESSE